MFLVVPPRNDNLLLSSLDHYQILDTRKSALLHLEGWNNLISARCPGVCGTATANRRSEGFHNKALASSKANS